MHFSMTVYSCGFIVLRVARAPARGREQSVALHRACAVTRGAVQSVKRSADNTMAAASNLIGVSICIRNLMQLAQALEKRHQQQQQQQRQLKISPRKRRLTFPIQPSQENNNNNNNTPATQGSGKMEAAREARDEPVYEF